MLNSVLEYSISGYFENFCESMTDQMRNLTFGTAIAVLLAGCASSSKEIATAYVSPMQYQSYNCEQLTMESQRIQVRVTELSGRLDEAARNDKVITGVGLVLFWPALFALGGTKHQEAEYSRLKGEHEAVQQALIAKQCALTPPPTETTAPTEESTAPAAS